MSYRHYVIAAVTVSSLVSCREELCYNHFGSADIELGWSSAPSVDPSEKPSGAVVITYDESGQPVETFLGAEGGNVSFGGRTAQSMLIYNSDTESIVLSGMSEGAKNVYATSTPGHRPAPDGIKALHPGEVVLTPPDMLYAAYIESLPDTDRHESASMSIEMDQLVFAYEVVYEFEHGFSKVADARGAIAGMAACVLLHNGETLPDAATLVYDCSLDNDAVKATVLSFGTPGTMPDGAASGRSSSRHTLNLEVQLSNGKSKAFNFDITGQMASQIRGGRIIVKGLRIEDHESGTDSGFNPDVEDWGNNEEIDIPVGGQ